jgi:hypothetical protein
MPISNIDDLIEGIKLRMGGNAENVTEDGLNVAAETALSELGWAIPVAHPLKIFWTYHRAVRHSTHILMIESAHKFRYKEIFLQNRFSHYKSLIDDMDKAFERAKDENPELFMDSVYIDDASITSSLSYYIPNVSDYDNLGRV